MHRHNRVWSDGERRCCIVLSFYYGNRLPACWERLLPKEVEIIRRPLKVEILISLSYFVSNVLTVSKNGVFGFDVTVRVHVDVDSELLDRVLWNGARAEVVKDVSDRSEVASILLLYDFVEMLRFDNVCSSFYVLLMVSAYVAVSMTIVINSKPIRRWASWTGYVLSSYKLFPFKILRSRGRCYLAVRAGCCRQAFESTD